MLSSKTKGRPPLEPRIAILEAQVKDLTEAVLELKATIEQIHTPAVRLAPERQDYRPLFDRWPTHGG